MRYSDHMRRRFGSCQEGIALVQTALMMVVLLGFVALAIDGGLLYAERRQMQNAADAGALAGARALCVGNPGAAVAQATNYAVTQNGAQNAAVQVAGNQVRVIASETVSTYFAGILGIPTFHIEAEAKAACGSTTRICGATPIMFSENLWDDIPCGSEFYVWDDASVGPDLSTKCDCEAVTGSAANLGPGDRGWIRFSSPPSPFPDPNGCGGNCGAAALKCWVRYSYSGPVEIGQCVGGQAGRGCFGPQGGGGPRRQRCLRPPVGTGRLHLDRGRLPRQSVPRDRLWVRAHLGSR